MMSKIIKALVSFFKSHYEGISIITFVVVFVAFFVLLVSSVINGLDEKLQVFAMVAILLLSMIAAIYPLIKKSKTLFYEKIIVFICFVILISSVVVFASVSKDQYREPIIQISSASTGGLITLYGVGITIKANRLENERKDIEKAKPNIFPISDQTWEQLPENNKLERDIIIHRDLTKLEKARRTDACYSLAPLYLENSDLSMCTLKGIGINNKQFIVFQFDNVMLKGSTNCFYVDYNFKYDGEIESVQLILGDMYGNTYNCQTYFIIDDSRKRKNRSVSIYGVLKTELLDADECKMFGMHE